MKCIKDWFKRTPKEPYIDPEREIYRKDFNILDDYLIGFNYEMKNSADGKMEPDGYIVYIDPENDIDWKDTRDKSAWKEEERSAFAQCIGKLTDADAEPTGHLDFDTIRKFRIKIGAGYVLAMNKCFDDVDRTIAETLHFIRQRKSEKARQLFLFYSTLIVAIVLGLWCLNKNTQIMPVDWALALLFGVLGAYFSIWTRYGKLVMTGLSSKTLHFLETLTRMIIGAISASVLVLAVKARILLPNLVNVAPELVFGLIGFVAGFSERIVPSLVEVFSRKIVEK